MDRASGQSGGDENGTYRGSNDSQFPNLRAHRSTLEHGRGTGSCTRTPCNVPRLDSREQVTQGRARTGAAGRAAVALPRWRVAVGETRLAAHDQAVSRHGRAAVGRREGRTLAEEALGEGVLPGARWRAAISQVRQRVRHGMMIGRQVGHRAVGCCRVASRRRGRDPVGHGLRHTTVVKRGHLVVRDRGYRRRPEVVQRTWPTRTAIHSMRRGGMLWCATVPISIRGNLGCVVMGRRLRDGRRHRAGPHVRSGIDG
jgi:hypothetical protein